MTSLLPQMLHPAYRDLVARPAEMYGFWLWTGPEAVKDQVSRTGANASSLHLTMKLVQEEASPNGVRPVSPEESFPDLDAVTEIGLGIGIGEHNNPFFVRYPDWFWELRPEAAMRDKSGEVIRASKNSVPAVDDALLTKLACHQMREIAGHLASDRRVRYWVLGGEQSYPDYFGLPEGDYRPESVRHYYSWGRLRGVKAEPGTDRTAWHNFRDSSLVDRFALYTALLREKDPSRPIFIPTHGNPFALDLRSRMGYPLADLAGAADGFEAGPISIDDDPERLVRFTLDQQTSFGVPVVAPRLANKQLDPNAVGGGRGFSPQSLCRTVYEALGMGAWHLGLVHWVGNLHDGEWGIVDTPAEAESKRVFAELKAAAPYLDGCSRLQPQVGIYISDATWQNRWQDRWTLLYDEAVKRGWWVVLLTDRQIGPELSKTTPVLLSVDNPVVAQQARSRITAYTGAGGKVISVGDFASRDRKANPASPPSGVIIIPEIESGEKVKIIHQTQTTQGANTWASEVRQLPMDALEAAVSGAAETSPIGLIGPIRPIGPMATPVETLFLTDGTNVLTVLINRSAERREVRISPSRQLQEHLGRWISRDAVSSKELPNGTVVLEGFGTALISVEPVVDLAVVEEEVSSARRIVDRWENMGADTAYYHNILSRASGHLDAGRLPKAYALACNVTQGLALKADASCDGGSFRVGVKVWNAEGIPDGAQVRVRLVPGPFDWHELIEATSGEFEIKLPDGRLPRFYNPSTQRYEIADGLTRLIIDASSADSQGGLRMEISLNNPAD